MFNKATTDTLQATGYLAMLSPINYGEIFNFVATFASVAVVILFLSTITEREIGWFFSIGFVKRFVNGWGSTFKPIIAFIVCLRICYIYGVDVFSMMFPPRTIHLDGVIATAALISGGAQSVVTWARSFIKNAKELEQAARETQTVERTTERIEVMTEPKV